MSVPELVVAQEISLFVIAEEIGLALLLYIVMLLFVWLLQTWISRLTWTGSRRKNTKENP